ncbi:MAG: hypothetical protein AB2541_06945 [Candidatus Thiodiazotropha sp.]
MALIVEPLKSELGTVKESLAQVQNELKQVMDKNDDLEQYSRRSCLRISGIPENSDEDVTKIILDLSWRVNAEIVPQDIDRAHRVGKVRNLDPTSTSRSRQFQTSREIIVKFCNSAARLKLLKGRAVLREQKAKIYVNEDLTQKRKNLAYECRRLKKLKHINKTWVYNGNVFVQDNSGAKKQIMCIDDLDGYRLNRNEQSVRR